MFISLRYTLFYKEIKTMVARLYGRRNVPLVNRINHMIDSTFPKMYKFKFVVRFPVERKD